MCNHEAAGALRTNIFINMMAIYTIAEDIPKRMKELPSAGCMKFLKAKNTV